jgi:hypothetical protein
LDRNPKIVEWGVKSVEKRMEHRDMHFHLSNKAIEVCSFSNGDSVVADADVDNAGLGFLSKRERIQKRLVVLIWPWIRLEAQTGKGNT